MPKLFELERDRASEASEARKIVEKAIAENRDTSPEEKTLIETRKTKIKDLSQKIELYKLADTFESGGPDARQNNDGGSLHDMPDLPDLDGDKPYSVLRALRMSLDVREGKGRFDGLEAEVHQTLNSHRRELGMNPAQGILLPHHLANPKAARKIGGFLGERRDLTTGAAAGGIANILGSTMIEVLRNRMVMELLGAQVLTGLTGGTFSWPKQSSTTTAYHTAEAIAAAKSNLTLGQVTWTPRTLTAITYLTRKAMLQTSLEIEAFARKDLMLTLGRAFDQTGVNGNGQNNQPLGILQDPGIPTVAIGTNGGEITWATVLSLETQVATANADFGSLAYLTSNKGRGVMKQTAKVTSSAFPIFLWEKGEAPGFGEVNSYRSVSSEQVPSNLTKGSANGTCTALIFGNFASAVYGLWSGIDVLVDPYTQGPQGGIGIYLYQDYDFQFLYEQSFAKCTDMLNT
jgi:HK97 family phage major capsid protein